MLHLYRLHDVGYNATVAHRQLIVELPSSMHAFNNFADYLQYQLNNQELAYIFTTHNFMINKRHSYRSGMGRARWGLFRLRAQNKFASTQISRTSHKLELCDQRCGYSTSGWFRDKNTNTHTYTHTQVNYDGSTRIGSAYKSMIGLKGRAISQCLSSKYVIAWIDASSYYNIK